jgi:hypothetical protein
MTARNEKEKSDPACGCGEPGACSLCAPRIFHHERAPASRRACGRAAGRTVLAGLSVLALAGCGLSKTAFSLPNGQPLDVNCHAVAADRASDAGIIGEDRQTQRSVFERTYVNCVAWRQTH